MYVVHYSRSLAHWTPECLLPADHSGKSMGATGSAEPPEKGRRVYGNKNAALVMKDGVVMLSMSTLRVSSGLTTECPKCRFQKRE